MIVRHVSSYNTYLYTKHFEEGEDHDINLLFFGTVNLKNALNNSDELCFTQMALGKPMLKACEQVMLVNMGPDIMIISDQML